MKYTRVTGKLFGGSASPSGSDPEIGQFGSAKAGTYIGTSDIATIQALAAWQQGFIGCVTPNQQFPPLPEMTAFGKVLSYQNCYLLQQGLPEWDNNTTYYTDNWCSYNKKIWVSLEDNNEGNNPEESDKWLEYTFSAVGNIGEPQITLDFTIVDAPTNCVWLNGDQVDKTTYAALYAIYGDNYWDGITVLGENKFQLPNVTDKTFWGGLTAGYIQAGLPNITGKVGTISNVSRSGAFYTSGSSGAMQDSGGDSDPTLYFDASRSNSIYGNSTTVQPPSIKFRAYTRYQ